VSRQLDLLRASASSDLACLFGHHPEGKGKKGGGGSPGLDRLEVLRGERHEGKRERGRALACGTPARGPPAP